MNKFEQIKQMNIDEMAKELMLVANWNPKDKAKAEKIYGKNNPELYKMILQSEVVK
jgi:hypothetical protein